MRKIMLVALVVLVMVLPYWCSGPSTDYDGGFTTPEVTESTSPDVIQYEGTHELPPTGGLKIVP